MNLKLKEINPTTTSKSLLNTGIFSHTSIFDEKRIKIVNFCSYFCLFITLFFLLFNFLNNELNSIRAVTLISELFLFSSIIFLQKKKKYVLARGIFVFLIYAILIIQNNIIYLGFYGEYLYLLVPILSILFFDHFGIHIFIGILSILLFYLPNIFLELYPAPYFGYANAFFLFTGITYIVYFFKKENRRIENHLQKNNQLISQQNEQLTTQNKIIEEAYQQLEVSKQNELNASKLIALKAQMNPHFIFNALNSIQYLILTKEIAASNQYLGKFADLMRRILHESEHDYTSLEEEIEILHLYLDIEKLRFEDNFSYQIQCDLDLDTQAAISVPSMFLQPYVENAIQHGLLHKKDDRQLHISFRKKGNALICEIIDNGIGRQKSAAINTERKKYHVSFSTKANKNRIELINENLIQKIKIHTIDLFQNEQPSGTKVLIHFPLNLGQ